MLHNAIEGIQRCPYAKGHLTPLACCVRREGLRVYGFVAACSSFIYTKSIAAA